MKARFVVLLLISAGLLTATGVPDIEAQTGMNMLVTTTDGTDITISGETTRTDDITVSVINSNTSYVIFVDQEAPNADGTYSFYRSTDSEGWPEDGIYQVTAQQRESGAYRLSASIEVQDGRLLITEDVSRSSLDKPVDIDTSPEVLSGLVIDVTADIGSDVIVIDGTTTSQAHAVTVLVTSPSGNKVHTDQVFPSPSGAFNTVVNIGCPHWEESGFYTVDVQQGGNSLFQKSVDVEISECLVVPEFGALAMAVLVVSIVAIVVLGARSRLSIMPRY